MENTFDFQWLDERLTEIETIMQHALDIDDYPRDMLLKDMEYLQDKLLIITEQVLKQV